MTAWATVAQLREYLPQVPELGAQVITVTGAPAGGTFTLDYEGTASAAIARAGTATAVQTALRAITAIGNGGVNVKGRPGGPWRAEFQNTLATDAGPLSLGTNNLTGGVAPSVTIAPATDALLQSCLDRATDIVRNALRDLLDDPAFDFATYGSAATRVVYGKKSKYLALPAYQAGSVTLVEYQETVISPTAYSTVTDFWREEAGALERPYGWLASDLEHYRVTAVWGYGPIPDAAVQIVLEQAVNEWRSRDKGGFSDVVGVDGSGGIRAISGLNKLQMQVIQNIVAQWRPVAV